VNVPETMYREITNRPVSEWNVPPGSASRPIPRFLYRLAAPLRWWMESSLRIVAEECCKFPLRILTIVRNPMLRYGAPIPDGPEGLGLESWEARNTYLRACSESIEQMQRDNRWIGTLECQMAAQAYRQGAAWVAGNACRGKESEAPGR